MKCSGYQQGRGSQWYTENVKNLMTHFWRNSSVWIDRGKSEHGKRDWKWIRHNWSNMKGSFKKQRRASREANCKVFFNIFPARCKKKKKDIKHNSLHLERKYVWTLCVTRSSEFSSSSQKTFRISEQIMSADKIDRSQGYPDDSLFDVSKRQSLNSLRLIYVLTQLLTLNYLLYSPTDRAPQFL